MAETMDEPFVLLDDARVEGASDARVYRRPVETRIARRPEEVEGLVDWLGESCAEGETLAGYLAYEAGLALEPRLAARAAARAGATGPLGWFARFADCETIHPDDVDTWLAAQTNGTGAIGPMEPQLSAGAYAAVFRQLKEAISAGDIYQANLTLRLSGRYFGEPLALYRALRRDSAAGYGGVVFDGSHWVLSLSPELFIALHDGHITVKPMKGTAARGTTPEADRAAAARLAASEKDRAENLMIVDLMRNDISRAAKAGSVRVDNAFAVETYPTLHTMTTTVKATLADGRTVADLIRAIFPCGSITGAPKIRAMELIDEVERDARGIYCGAIGRIGPAAGGQGIDAAFNVAIRTLRLDTETKQATAGVGGAIVADSDGMGEWRECGVKGNFLRKGAARFDLIETMAFTPEQGIPLLERHLARLTRSAEALDFRFDRHGLRNAIQHLCFDATEPRRLRVVLAKDGEVSLELGPLPTPADRPWSVVLLPLPVSAGDWRLAHKSSDRGFYEDATAVARTHGCDEAVFVREDGLVTEGAITSVFVPRGDKLLTPRESSGLLPGVLRAQLLEEGRAQEADVTLDDLGGGFMLGNAVRGLIEARLA